MKKFTQCAWNAWSHSAAMQRNVRLNPRSPQQLTRLMYSSLHEASFFTVMDDGNDASQYGYRIFIPSSPKRTNGGGVVTSSNVIRQSSSSAAAQHYQSFHYPNSNHHRFNDYDNTRMTTPNDEYSKCMQSIDPSTLDILSSPEVMAILESQCDWEKYKNEMNEASDWSDCEQNPPAMSMESLDDKIPSIDEKKM
jgi:hypothetical protein